jgi:hypothetical protein
LDPFNSAIFFSLGKFVKKEAAPKHQIPEPAHKIKINHNRNRQKKQSQALRKQQFYLYKGSMKNLGAFPAHRAGNRAFRSNSSASVPEASGISASIPCAVDAGH